MLNHKPENPKIFHKNHWIIILLSIGLFVTAWLFWLSLNLFNEFSDGFQSPEMAAIKFSPKTIHAKLGGMPVSIPPHFANYVQYDGDPGWGEKRNSPHPSRTLDSSLQSFGFDFKYPDMQGLETPALGQEKREAKLRNTPWMTAGITSGTIFPGNGFLNRHFYNTIIKKPYLPEERYTKNVKKIFHLDAYVNMEISPNTGQRMREDHGIDDYYFHINSNENVTTVIHCGTAEKNWVQTCRQSFSLEPYSNTEVTVSYILPYLEHWKDIQEKTTQLLLSFKRNTDFVK